MGSIPNRLLINGETVFALGRGNGTFFDSDRGGKTAAVLRSFVASCKWCGVDPFAWFRDECFRIISVNRHVARV